MIDCLNDLKCAPYTITTILTNNTSSQRDVYGEDSDASDSEEEDEEEITKSNKRSRK